MMTFDWLRTWSNPITGASAGGLRGLPIRMR
jgi:hypothetical protein